MVSEPESNLNMMVNRIIMTRVIIVFSLLTLNLTCFADSASEVAKDLSNPANARASMSSNLEYISFDGDLDGASSQSNTVYLFQPSLPFPVGDSGKNILFRPALPIFISQSQFDPTENGGLGGFDDVSGKVGDIGFDLV